MTLKYHLLLDQDYGNQEKKTKLDGINTIVKDNLAKILLVESPEEADILLVWWGDGFMIEMIKKYKDLDKIYFGINAGTVWFILNHMNTPDLPKTLEGLNIIDVPIINTKTTTHDNGVHDNFFINDLLIGVYWGNFHCFELTSKTQWKLIDIFCSEALINTPLWSTWQALNGDLPLMDMKSKLLGVTCARPKWFKWGYLKPEEITITDTRWRDPRKVAHDGKNPDNMIDNVKEVTIYPPERYAKIAFKHDEDYHDRRILLAQESLWNVILWKNWWVIN